MDTSAAVIDGANVAYEERSHKGDPRVSNIVAVREALVSRGYSPIVIIDASVRHEVDDPAQLEGLIDNRTVRQAPAGTDADYFVLETADREDALVVSNVSFESYRDRHPWIDDRRVRFMIINGEVELHVPDLPGD